MLIIYSYLFYYISALIGISIGYHRYFTHKSFKTSWYLEIIMLVFGLICGGRSALTWVGVHRMHHSNSDTFQDPHSPKFKGIWTVLTSRWRVHHIPKKYISDLIKNPRIIFFHKYGKYLHFMYAIVMMIIGYEYFLIFVAFPFLLSWLGFGLLNVFAHKSGEPKNVLWLNIFAPGEAWHKNHHEHPKEFRLHKYDIAGWTIEKIFTKSKFSS